MSNRIRIKSNGTSNGTSIECAGCGASIVVRKVTWVIEAGDIAQAFLEVPAAQVDLEVNYAHPCADDGDKGS
jgi:hypothetical protein